jgi:Membrane domain of glycerophosphoryl diester phosphodiesterase
MGPMRAELRPSSLGEILDRTAQMYRSHFLVYFGIASIAYAATLVLSLTGNVLFFSHVHANPRAFAKFTIGLAGTLGVLTLLPVAVGMAAVMHSVARNYLGETSTIREAYASVGRRWYRYVLILGAIYCYGVLPIAFLIGVVAIGSVLIPAGMARVVVVGIAAVLLFACIFVVAWWMLRWALAIPASLMENLKVHRALKRSSALTKGGIGRIFVMLLLVGAVMTVIQYAIQIPIFVLLYTSKGPTLTTQVVASFGGFFSGSFVLPIYSIALTLFYYDQRIRKEGYDVEWLMEQAAVVPGASSDTVVPGSVTPGSPTPGSLTPGSLAPQTEPPGPAI